MVFYNDSTSSDWQKTSLDVDDVMQDRQYNCTETGGGKNEKRKMLTKPKNFGTKIFLMV